MARPEDGSNVFAPCIFERIHAIYVAEAHHNAILKDTWDHVAVQEDRRIPEHGSSFDTVEVYDRALERIERALGRLQKHWLYRFVAPVAFVGAFFALAFFGFFALICVAVVTGHVLVRC